VGLDVGGDVGLAWYFAGFGPLPSFVILRFPKKHIFFVFHLYFVCFPARQ
jgi:hypothetical protein